MRVCLLALGRLLAFAGTGAGDWELQLMGCCCWGEDEKKATSSMLSGLGMP